MESSILCDEPTLDTTDIVPHGISRKLDDELSEAEESSKEKRPRLDDEELAKQQMCVFLRVRPFTEKEIGNQEKQGCMEIENQYLLVAKAPVNSNTYKNSQHGCGKQTHRFTFTRIFEESTTQKEFFDNTVLAKVKDFIGGQNCLIFTYGVSNSGKTYTIQGHAKDGGILPRALDVLFNSIGTRQCDEVVVKPSMFSDVVRLSEMEAEAELQIKKRVFDMALHDEDSDITVSSLVGDSDMSRLTTASIMSEDSLNADSGNGSEHTEISDKSAMDQVLKEAADRVREDGEVNVSTNEHHQFSIWVTFVEIYNEYIYDLLEPIPKKKTVRRATVTLREDRHGVPYVKGVKQILVNSADEAYKILVIGQQNLQMACTKLNHNSSRSHCIFTIKLLRLSGDDNLAATRVNMLSFCDLAGAERYSKTFTGGDRIKEAGNINTSLLSLGRCIKILRHNQLNKDHPQIVPFRDSKLTRIFQSSLTGKGRAAMIVNINQCASTFDETLHALKYSAIAKQVVLVQDPVKEPNPPKLVPLPGSSRYVSLLLAQAHTDPSGIRQTIGFGTPGTLTRILQEEEDNAATPKAEEDHEALLMEIIETLKVELIKERNEKSMLEWNVRSEVFTEVQEQLHDQELHFEERMREMKERMEDRTDSKVNLLLQSMKKKKRRIIDNDECVDQTDMMRAALEAKDSQIEILQDRISALEKDVEALGQQPQKTPPRKPEGPVEHRQEHTDQMAVIEQLQAKLSDAKVQLEAKEMEVVELGEMLTEAGETFEQKAAEIEKLEKTLTTVNAKAADQESRLKELTEANKTLDAKVASLLAELKAADSKDCSSCQEQVVRLGEVVFKLADTEAEVDKINNDFMQLQQKLAHKTSDAENLRKDLTAKEQEIMTLRSNISEGVEKESQVRQMLTQIEGLEKELGSYKDASRESEKQLQETQDSNAKLEAKVEKLQKVITEHQDALRDHETFVAELNKQLTESKSSLEDLTVEHLESSNEIKELLEKVTYKEEELFDNQEKLVILEEKHEQLTKDLATKEKRLFEDGRHSLQLENKVVGLEQSLQQANALLRETALKASCVEVTLNDLKKTKEALETEHNNCTPCIQHLQTQLDDYIVRVNEQVDIIGELKDKQKAEDQNAGDLQTKLIEVQGKLVDRDGELKHVWNTVTDLETRLAAERKQQKSAGTELGDLLQCKAITIEELNTNVSQLNKKLNKKQNEVEMSNEQIERLQTKLEQLKDEFKDHKAQLSIGKLTESQLKDGAEQSKELEMAQEKLSNMANDLEKSNCGQLSLREKLEAAENKISSLEMSLEMYQETGEEVIELRETVEKQKVKLLSLEVKSSKIDIGVNSSSDVEALQNEIRCMKNEVSEAQYAAQVNGRTLRREKSQVERRLKETEEELKEARTNMLKMQSDIAAGILARKSSNEESNCNDDGLRKKLKEQIAKANRLADVLNDLKACLNCAKSSQMAAEERLEMFKQKCRGLEDDAGLKEDRMQSLESRLSELDMKTRDIENKKEEISRLNDSVCELEHRCKEYRSGMENLEARLSYIGMLEEKNESILSELDEHDRKVQGLEMMLVEAEKRITALEKMVAEDKDAKEQLKASITVLEGRVAEVLAENCELKEKHGTELAEKEHLLEGLKYKSTTHTKLSEQVSHLKACVEQLEATITEKGDALNLLQTEKDTLAEKLSAESAKLNEATVALDATLAQSADLALKSAIKFEGSSELMESVSMTMRNGENIYSSTVENLNLVKSSMEMSQSALGQQSVILDQKDSLISDLREKLNKQIEDAEVQLKQLDTNVSEQNLLKEKLKENKSLIKDLKEQLKNQVIDTEQKSKQLATKTSEVKQIEETLKENGSLVSDLRDQLKNQAMDTEEKITKLQTKKAQQFEEKMKQNESLVNDLKEQLKDQILETEEKMKQLETNSGETSKLKNNIKENDCCINDLREQLRKKIKDTEEKTEQFDTTTSEINQLNKKLQENESLISNIRDQLKAQVLDTEERTKQFDIKTIEVDNLKEQLAEKESLTNALREQLKQHIGETEAKSVGSEAKLLELETRLVKMNQLEEELKDHQHQLVTMKNSLAVAETEKANAVTLLSTHEATIETFKGQVALLKSEVHTLSNKVEMLMHSSEESTVTLQTLRLEVDVKDRKIADLTAELNTARETVATAQDLEKAHKREKDLRRQLSESSTRQEEQNKKIDALEDRVRALLEEAERHEEAKKASRDALTKLKEELRMVRSELSTSTDERKCLEQRLVTEQASLQTKVETLEQALEKKEAKLKARSCTISEVMAKMEAERNSYEISTQDARANEAVLGQLKKALEDQDATIELQEKALMQKEEEIAATQKAHEAMVEKYNAMLKDTSAQHTSVRDLTRQLAKLREERKEAERLAADAEKNLQQARAAVGRSDKEKVQFKRDMEDTNNELREMEKMLSGARHEIDQLKCRLSEMRGGQPKPGEPGIHVNHDEQKLALLKTKFIALESKNAQLEGKLEERQREMAQAEVDKKTELKQWREDRDKLVSQLEKILKQKEAQISEMKKMSNGTPKTNHELTNRIDKLELEVADKESIINELSRHLDSNAGKTRGDRRNTRHNLSAGDDWAHAVKKDSDELRKQFEADRQAHSRDMARMVKAKDEIINDLRHTNLQLQARLPAANTQFYLPVQPDTVEVKDTVVENVDPAGQKVTRKSTRGKGRPRKRKSSDLEDKLKASKRHQSTRKQEFQLQVSFDEIQEMPVTKKDDALVELQGLLVSTPTKRAALTETLTTATLANFISPVKKPSIKNPPLSERSRRRVRLRTTVDEQFSESPPLTPGQTPSKDQSHEIVTRQLRTRKKQTNV